MRGAAKVQDEGAAWLVLCGQSPVRLCAVVFSVGGFKFRSEHHLCSGSRRGG
jgi:hypothetical protein